LITDSLLVVHPSHFLCAKAGERILSADWPTFSTFVPTVASQFWIIYALRVGGCEFAERIGLPQPSDVTLLGMVDADS